MEDRSMAILYGSETGNSEDIAMEVDQMVRRLHFTTDVGEMNGFKLKDMVQFSLVVFVTSTTGQGEVPSNATRFWRNLRRQTLNGTNCLARVRFTIFGLGDSSYTKFNWAARKLRGRLLQLGASDFFRAGEGDERHDDGIDSNYLPWYQELRSTLLTEYALPESVEAIPDDVPLPSRYTLRIAAGKRANFLDKDKIITDHKYDLEPAVPPLVLPIPDTFGALMYKNERVTPEDHWQDVRLLGFHISASKNEEDKLPDIGPGSTIILYPKNLPQDVQMLIDLMGWNKVADLPTEWDSPAQSRPAGHRSTFASPKIHHPDEFPTLRSLLGHSFDITAIPKRRFLSQLQYYTADAREKERLGELVHTADEFYDYVPRPRRTIIEVLQDFPGVKIPIEDVISVLPLIRGREYSIANGVASQSERASDDSLRIEVLAALVEYKTVIRKSRTGLCSRYLKHLPPGTLMQVGFNKVGSMKNCSGLVESLQIDQEKQRRPVMAVATGTGIAPFRSVLQDRLTAAAKTEVCPMGPVLLFYGCRSEHADFHFGNEWRSHEARGELELHAAFSRDAIPVGSAKSPDSYDNSSSSDMAGSDYDRGRNYVQHHIRHHAKRVAELLQQKPLVMVCGGAGRMPTSVWAALQDVLVLEGVVETRTQAEAWLKDEEKVTFWQETW